MKEGEWETKTGAPLEMDSGGLQEVLDIRTLSVSLTHSPLHSPIHSLSWTSSPFSRLLMHMVPNPFPGLGPGLWNTKTLLIRPGEGPLKRPPSNLQEGEGGV